MLDAGALDRLFRTARTQNRFLDRPVSGSVLEELYALTKFGPTSANCSPARFVFLQSEAAKQRLLPAVLRGNQDKIMTAPVTVIVAYDLEFYEQLPLLFPHTDARSWFAGNEALIEATAFRNGSLQGAYLIMAARALGLDCGPMSGFDNTAVDAEFFAESRYRSNFLVNLGYGDAALLHPRSPRPAFQDTCRII